MGILVLLSLVLALPLIWSWEKGDEGRNERGAYGRKHIANSKRRTEWETGNGKRQRKKIEYMQSK